jgi:YaiO family outer membrane protein
MRRSTRTPRSRSLAALAVPAALALAACAANAVEVSLDASHARLTHGYDDQDSQILQLAWSGPGGSLTQVSLENKRAFGEHATIAVGSHAWDLDADDRLYVAAAFSDAPTIAARWRADVQYSRKLLPQRNLVGSLALYSSRTADGHSDTGTVGSFAWYFADRQVAEAGVRYATSNPGAHSAWRGFAAYTYGAVGETTFVVRGESGREAYQSLGDGAAVADFESHEVGIAARHWVSKDLSFAARASYYSNPTYSKNTVGITAFIDF